MNQNQRPTFQYLGHSTVLVTLDDGRTMLVDPWVGQNPSCPDEAKEIERIDAMLITHGHFDHMGDAVELAKEHEPEIVVATFEICGWLESQGVENCSGMNLGGSQEVLGTRVTQVQAFHTSSIDTASSGGASSGGTSSGGEHGMIYGGTASGFVVTLPDGWAFYHAGDTALFSDMALLADLYRPHLAFLPIGDLFTMDPHQAALACKFLEVREVIPIHWGTFPALTGTPADLEKELADEGVNCKVVTLEPGDSY